MRPDHTASFTLAWKKFMSKLRDLCNWDILMRAIVEVYAMGT